MQAVANRKGGRRRLVVGSGLVEDARQVIGNHVLAQGQFLRDPAIAHASRHEPKDLHLPRREPGRVYRVIRPGLVG
jgi:hypothetical protein